MTENDAEHLAKGLSMQQLSRLEQETADSRQHHSLQPAPRSVTHKLRYQCQDTPDKHLGQEAVMISSSAPAHMMTQLPPIRTSIPSLSPKQVRRALWCCLISLCTGCFQSPAAVDG